DLPKARCFHEHVPRVALGAAPDIEHAHVGPVTLRHRDPARDGDAVAELELLDCAWRGLAVRPLDKERVVAGHADRAAIAGPHLETPTRRRVSDQRCRGRGYQPGALLEGGHGGAVERVLNGLRD